MKEPTPQASPAEVAPEKEGTPEPIAIIGIGCMFPKAKDLQSFWSNIRNGVDAITETPETHWDPKDFFDSDPDAKDKTYGRRGGFLDATDFDPLEFGISPRDVEATDTSQLLGLAVAKRALADAGYPADAEDLPRDRVSVVLGVTGTLELVIPLGARLGHPIWRRALEDAGVDETTADDVCERIGESYVDWQENSFPGLLGNVVAGRIANRLDLHGTNCVVDAACASSLSAMHLSMLELRTGRSDMVVTGGVDTFNDIFMYMCFSKTPALSPTGDARPFAEAGDGTILGEGVGMMVLKRLSDAERDDDRIYAVIRGMGTASDGKGDAVYAPTADGQARCLRNAYENAGVSPDTIELLEAHGTGTKVGDATEIRGLTSVYGDTDRKGSWCALGSVKSMIGHTKAAAGSAGVIKAAMALYKKVLPPTIKVDQPNDAAAPDSTPFYINTEPRPWLSNPSHPRRAGVSAFGFGGSNFHCVLEEYVKVKPSIDWDGRVQLIAISARDRKSLSERIEELRDRIEDSELDWSQLRGQAARTRAAFDPSDPCRVALVVERDGTDAAKILRVASQRVVTDDAPRWSTPNGIHYASGSPAGSVAAVFPGQGSQHTDMLRDLVCSFPSARDALAATERDLPLVDSIYPRPAFDGATRKRNEDALRQTQIAQPAIGAVSLGALRVLQEFGVTFAATTGHSYGELTALCAARRISETDFHALSILRGQLMSRPDDDSPTDRGSMLAVMASVQTVEEFLTANGLDLVIANRNAPRQIVLSGATDVIESAEELLRAQHVRSTRLNVSAAFHSPLVANASTPLAKALAHVHFATGEFPVFANSTGTEYAADSAAARDLLAGQLAAPVEFQRAIENMRDQGVSTFVEVGPGRAMTGLIRAITKGDPDVVTTAIDASGDGWVDLARTLASLAANGHAVDVTRWDPDYLAAFETSERTKEPTFTIPLSGANYTTPREPRPKVARPAAQPSISPPRTPTETPVSRDSEVNAAAMHTNQESLKALVRMQEQTADLHRLFLESQQQIVQGFQQLIAQQHAAAGLEPPLPMAPIPMAPIAMASPPAAPMPAAPAPAPSAVPAIEPVARPEPVRPPTTAQPAHDDVAIVLLDVVAEKTGYPAEMLELSMGLDADLGIDSIKRVEILSTLQEKLPHAPVVKPEHLGELSTLGQIAAFLSDGSEPSAAVSEPRTTQSPAVAENAQSIGDRETYTDVLIAIVADKTGYPAEMLELSMGLDADLGIDSIKRVEILSALQEQLPNAPVVKPEHLGELQTLGQIVDFLTEGEAPAAKPVAAPEPVPSAPSITRSVLRHSIGNTPNGASSPLRPEALVWVTRTTDGLSQAIVDRLRSLGVKAHEIERTLTAKPPADLAGVLIVASATPPDSFLHQTFSLTRLVGPALRAAAEDDTALFVTVSRLDGSFGLGELNPDAPVLSGGLAGLTKTVDHEWPQVIATAIDVDANERDTTWLAERIVSQVFTGASGEFGIHRDGTTVLELSTEEVAVPPVGAPASSRFTESDVIVITGGARGVTAEVAVALARSAGPRLALLGRSPAPTPEPDWLRDLEDETSIKQAILARAAGKLSPRELGDEFVKVQRNREVLRNIARMEEAGSRVSYTAVDVRDAETLRERLAELNEQLGPFTGLIHGAGVLADSYIADKSDEDFARVFATKVEGLDNLIAALAPYRLKALVTFSSSTARFGRTGQADYAMANEVLNKIAQREHRRRPDCRVVSFNWGPWDGGMVTPALRNMFAGEGVSVIGLTAGAEYLVDELAHPQGPVEIVVLGGGSRLPNYDILPRAEASSLSAIPELPTVFDRELSVATDEFLRAHVIDGKAVVPAALIVEWLGHGALHGNPGLRFCGFDEFRVYRGVTLTANDTIRLRVCADRASKSGEQFVVQTELCSTDATGNRVLHARAKIGLSSQLEVTPQAAPARVLAPYNTGLDAAYDQLLFHGKALQGLTEIDGCDDSGIVAVCKPAPAPREWSRQPLRSRWITDPLALDCAFQAMILWSFDQHRVGSLPTEVSNYRQFKTTFPKDGVRIEVRVTEMEPGRAAADIDFLDVTGVVIAKMTGYHCVLDASLNDAFRRNTLDTRSAAQR